MVEMAAVVWLLVNVCDAEPQFGGLAREKVRQEFRHCHA